MRAPRDCVRQGPGRTAAPAACCRRCAMERSTDEPSDPCLSFHSSSGSSPHPLAFCATIPTRLFGGLAEISDGPRCVCVNRCSSSTRGSIPIVFRSSRASSLERSFSGRLPSHPDFGSDACMPLVAHPSCELPKTPDICLAAAGPQSEASPPSYVVTCAFPPFLPGPMGEEKDAIPCATTKGILANVHFSMRELEAIIKLSYRYLDTCCTSLMLRRWRPQPAQRVKLELM